MKALKAFSALLAVLACFSAKADDVHEGWHLTLHTFSHHFNERKNGKQWNNDNFGIGLRREFSSDFSVQAGAFRNSLDKWSTYAIGEYTPLAWGDFRAGLHAGVRTNYSKPVMFAGGALVRWQKDRYSVTLRAAPKVCGSCANVVTLELGFRF